MTGTTQTAGTEHRASWLELFFDLVVVVAMAQLVHHLHAAPTGFGLGEYLLLYTAIWMSWTSFMLYSNVAAERTRRRTMLLAMAGIGVMAAAIPEATGASSTAFGVAFIVVRVLAAVSWQSLNTAVLGPAGAGVALWTASMWTDHPLRQWLWAAGLLLDLISSIVTGRDPESARSRTQAHRDEQYRRLLGRGRGGGVAPAIRPPVRVARLDVGHFGERLGLFVIIVLGEAVAQLVLAASEPNWTRPLALAAAAGFGLLVGLWWLTFQYGFTAAPHTRLSALPPGLTLPIHLLTTAAIGMVAAGLGTIIGDPEAAVADGVRWILCGGLAAYFLISAISGLVSQAPLVWLLGWALPTVVAPIAVAAFAGGLAGWALALILVLMVLWQATYNWTRQRLGTARTRRTRARNDR